MDALQDRSDIFPRISVRPVKGGSEAYVPGTGLTVWEIAWIASSYDRDIQATMHHLGQSREVVEAALRYADAYPVEIEAAITRHIDRPVEELLQVLPEMRILEFDSGAPGEEPT